MTWVKVPPHHAEDGEMWVNSDKAMYVGASPMGTGSIIALDGGDSATVVTSASSENVVTALCMTPASYRGPQWQELVNQGFDWRG